MADKEQTKWSSTYSMKYSHTETLVDTSSLIKVFVTVIQNSMIIITKIQQKSMFNHAWMRVVSAMLHAFPWFVLNASSIVSV